MQRRDLLHLAGVLILVATYLLLPSPAAAAQPVLMSLPGQNGIAPCGKHANTTLPEKANPQLTFCLGVNAPFAVVGFGSPGEVQNFTTSQTNPGILEFSNAQNGPFVESITIRVVISADGSGQSDPFWIRGAKLGESVFSACASRCIINPTDIAVVNVASMEFEPMDSPLDANPNAGGGLRIFPDKTSPNDTVNRRAVRVKATISMPIAGVQVYFKAFDVDDPSTDDSIVDPTGPAGNDNRGAQNLDTVVSAPTDANGTAEIILNTTVQPGDNYRIAAACTDYDLQPLHGQGTDVLDGGGAALPTDHANVTPMITVWRRVHIEVDSMGSISGNNVTGTVRGARSDTSTNITTLFMHGGITDSIRFAQGRIVLPGLGSFPLTGVSDKTVSIPGIFTSKQVKGKAFTLFDDDDLSDDDGALSDGDQGEYVPTPDTNLLQDSDNPAQNVFAAAYVKPIYDLSGSRNDVPFVANTPEPGGASDLIPTYRFDAQQTEADPGFWTVYLLGAYQYTIGMDNDPDGEGGPIGIVDDINGVGASVFNELFTSHEGFNPTPIVNPAATAAHEIGHLFGGQHTDGGLMKQSRDRTEITFSPTTLNVIRSLAHP